MPVKPDARPGGLLPLAIGASSRKATNFLQTKFWLAPEELLLRDARYRPWWAIDYNLHRPVQKQGPYGFLTARHQWQE
jgi:hypothetical protein